MDGASNSNAYIGNEDKSTSDVMCYEGADTGLDTISANVVKLTDLKYSTHAYSSQVQKMIQHGQIAEGKAVNADYWYATKLCIEY